MNAPITYQRGTSMLQPTPGTIEMHGDVMRVTPPAAPFVPGVFHDMPAARYHEIEALSSSGAKKLQQSAAHYKAMRDQVSVPSAAMQFGTVCHAGVLEPETFAQVVAIAPDCDKRSVAGKATWANFGIENAGKIILDIDTYNRALRCIAAVLAHPAARRLLEGAKREVSLFWEDAFYKVPCKVRFDAANHGGLIDLKTCPDASPDAFSKAIANFLYHLQAGFYMKGAEAVLGEWPRFFAFIAVEAEPPHAVACYALPDEAIQVGLRLRAKALERYSEALKTGTWPGYPDTIDVINLPGWAMKFAQ